ncbi:MAG: DUF2844 domain-containing protein [Proteobacteria bacterium]|nr:MAG: DUF2844 domain-containing protein [Pseudomonadota bacterium]
MKILKAVLTAYFMFCGSSAHATLGEKATSIPGDVSKLKASQKAMVNEGPYSVHEMVANGTTIKEYSNAEGLVFAVSWRGLAAPDLEVLFGTYFAEYKQTLNLAPRQPGKRSVSMDTGRMVVRRSGHMRDQRGFAHVPSLVPAGLNLEDLK